MRLREKSTLKTSFKNEVLKLLAEDILKNKESIISENAKDIAAGKEKNLSPALLDRLLLNEKRIESLANSVCRLFLIQWLGKRSSFTKWN